MLHYLVRNGSERVVGSAREHLYDMRSLEHYSFVDDFGKDQGINGLFLSLNGVVNYLLVCYVLVRQKVKELIELIQDDVRLREERKKAKATKDKYVGVASDDFRYRRGILFGT